MKTWIQYIYLCSLINTRSNTHFFMDNRAYNTETNHNTVTTTAELRATYKSEMVETKTSPYSFFNEKCLAVSDVTGG